jgi:hypothetical protein
MAIALVTSITAITGTSSAIDTTGANLLVAAVSSFSAPTGFSDSKGNTWTALTAASNSNVACRIYYSIPGSVGSSHTFTGTGTYRTFWVGAFSGAASSSVFDVEASNTGSGTSGTPGSVTPAGNGSLLIIACDNNTGDPQNGTITGYTAINVNNGGSNMTLLAGYLVQSTAAASNPSMAWASSVTWSAVHAAFKAAAGGGSSFYPFLHQPQNWQFVGRK